MPYLINKQLSVRTINDEVFIFNRARARVHTFNKTGAFLWKQLALCDNSGQLADRLSDNFIIERVQAEADVKTFLQTIQELDLVEFS